MSDEPREAKRKMEKVFLCTEIWFDCLPFLSRAKVGLEFALVSDRFDGLADEHLNSTKKRPWTLGKLSIERERNDAIIIKNRWAKNEKHLPFPDGPLPENVIGFNYILICSVDQNVIDFLRRIRRLFQPKNNGNDGIELMLYICSSQVHSWGVFFDYIWPLINPSAITKLNLPRENSFDVFCRRISPTFLLGLANVRAVDLRSDTIKFEDGRNGQLLRQWLYTPREDGNPKLLNIRMKSDAVEQLKTEFLSAQNALSFIIAFVHRNVLFVPFEVENWRTGERLTFQKLDKCNWLLERGPIEGRNVEQWAKWEREAMREVKKHNLLSLFPDAYSICSHEEAAAGPSGQ